MNGRTFLLATVITSMVFGSATAETSSVSLQYGQAYTSCMRAADTTVSMVECITSEYGRHDEQLNKEYKALMAQLTPDRKTVLQRAQRAWVAYRDHNCDFYHDPDGGTLATLEANMCMLDMTALRAAELKRFNETN